MTFVDIFTMLCHVVQCVILLLSFDSFLVHLLQLNPTFIIDMHLSSECINLMYLQWTTGSKDHVL